jgi:hypothetical protein
LAKASNSFWKVVSTVKVFFGEKEEEEGEKEPYVKWRSRSSKES